jgi:tetratricopeptide (TPR) repeat protein
LLNVRNEKGEKIVNISYYRLIMTVFIMMGLMAPAFGQNTDEEARKYLVRGMAAIEMAKSEAGFAAAATEFKKATELAPTMAAAWYNLGSVQSKMGQLKDAIASYRRYVILAPKADDARLVNDEIIKLEYKLERAEANVLKKDGRFIAYVDGTVLDTRTNLMWAAKDNEKGISWEDANNYCENYRGGGYTDWRMPTQDEIGGLCNTGKAYQSECRGPLGGTWNIHTTELIRLTCHLSWTSKLGSDNDARAIDFDRFVMPWLYKSSVANIRVLPVRSGK